MFQRFSDRARRVVVQAQHEARRLGHSHIGSEHLLLGLVHEGGTAVAVLGALGVSSGAVRERTEQTAGTGSGPPPGHIPFTPEAKKVLELSLREALELEHGYIGTEHILLGLIRAGEGVAYQVLTGLDVRHDRARELVIELVGAAGKGTPPEGAAPEVRVARPAGLRLGDDVLRQLDDITARLRAVEARLGIEPAGSPGPSVTAELTALRDEVTRLAGLLREHGIDPGP